MIKSYLNPGRSCYARSHSLTRPLLFTDYQGSIVPVTCLIIENCYILVHFYRILSDYRGPKFKAILTKYSL